jgi:DNA-binding response OmpR family regulator
MEEEQGTILIVDDEESIRGILSRKLEGEGYHCEVAADGKEALWKAFLKDYDLVLMDIKMPGMSGMEALPQMINNHPDICVLMTTALIDTETAVEAMKLGAYDYVTKPFDLDDLTMRVAKALERRKLAIENREYSYRLEQKVRQQTEQMQQYYRESVEALSREQIAIEELRTVNGTQPNEKVSGAEVALKSHEQSSSVKEFAKKLSQLFNKATPSLEDEGEKSDAVPLKTEVVGTESMAGGGGLAFYQGVVELSLQPPLSLQQIWQLYEHLKKLHQVKALNIIGSVDRDVEIKLVLDTPAPLLEFLSGLPEVEKVSDGLGENANKAASHGDMPDPITITVNLSAKPSTGRT